MSGSLDWAGRYDTVVIEGCDGAGKTSLSRAIAARFGAVRIHSTLTPAGTDLVTAYTNLLMTPGRLVLDRCFLSEAIYGPVYRNHSRLSDVQLLDLVAKVVHRNGVFVHLTATPADLRQRLVDRGDTDPPSISELSLLDVRYSELFAKVEQLAPVIRVDTFTGGN